MDRLKDKVAIVTGAGTREVDDEKLRGIGSATAVLFAREGARVILADIDAENAERTRAEIRAEGGEAEIVLADVSRTDECRAIVDAAIEHYGKLDILFNNVGVHGPGRVTEVEEENWHRVMDVGLKSMVFLCKYAIPKMATSGGGSVINISSIDGMRAGSSRNVPYGITKGGIITLTRLAAVHHGRENVRVNSIAPGHLHTTFVGNIPQELRERRRKIAPLGTEGNAWDIAWAAVFLGSDESRWISGVVLPVDAGLFAGSPLSMYDNLNEE